MSDFVGEASQNLPVHDALRTFATRPPLFDLQGVRQFLNVELAIFSRIILREGLGASACIAMTCKLQRGSTDLHSNPHLITQMRCCHGTC